ncbi:Nipped-B-like protein pqn-85, partial [Clarias magur]
MEVLTPRHFPVTALHHADSGTASPGDVVQSRDADIEDRTRLFSVTYKDLHVVNLFH